jgi:hypothetical protein
MGRGFLTPSMVWGSMAMVRHLALVLVGAAVFWVTVVGWPLATAAPSSSRIFDNSSGSLGREFLDGAAIDLLVGTPPPIEGVSADDASGPASETPRDLSSYLEDWEPEGFLPSVAWVDAETANEAGTDADTIDLLEDPLDLEGFGSAWDDAGEEEGNAPSSE